ncbi:hypothetical protein KFK09_023457 [Dendrobium nobile]|uniref:Uncharacterized protein n=1 Tax=Dendrobium nobile TaxID=94219 RepID=A0A8T3AL41_DENNO|nr:hypothetical protein KFK09_023457 [Dendrobium nobile]
MEQLGWALTCRRFCQSGDGGVGSRRENKWGRGSACNCGLLWRVGGSSSTGCLDQKVESKEASAMRIRRRVNPETVPHTQLLSEISGI